jgi:hypothetical protein
MNTISEFMDYLGIDVITNDQLRERIDSYIVSGVINQSEYDNLLDELDQL